MALLYDQPGYAYDQAITYDANWSFVSIGIGCRISQKHTPTIQIQARCSARSTRIFTCRADIQSRSSHTLTCQARISHQQHIQVQCRIVQIRQLRVQATIKNTVDRTIAMRVRFSRQQGFPIIDPSNPAFPLFQPTQLVLKAHIVNNIRRSAQALTVNTNISPRRSTSMRMQARIGRSGRLLIQANIVPKLFTTTVLGTFDVQGNLTTTVLATFNIAGLFSRPSLGVGARIVRLNTRRVVGHFTIPASTTTSALDSSIAAGGKSSSRAIVGIGAFIS